MLAVTHTYTLTHTHALTASKRLTCKYAIAQYLFCLARCKYMFNSMWTFGQMVATSLEELLKKIKIKNKTRRRYLAPLNC